jgi:hypothetical protein
MNPVLQAVEEQEKQERQDKAFLQQVAEVRKELEDTDSLWCAHVRARSSSSPPQGKHVALRTSLRASLWCVIILLEP